ncbi:NAD-dependent deacylase [bacterium BD-1]|nr:NAD-dependent deacylase [Ottowia caeni]
MSEEVVQARLWLREAQHITMLTGAGMSSESGVPTFRDAQTGHWARFRPEDLATEAAFRRDPERVWRWYAERRQNTGGVQPNAGHLAVAEFQRRFPGRLTLATQNVDGLHQKAGSTEVLALHGNLFEDKWLDPCALARRSQDACFVGQAEPGVPPRCAHCGNMVRPAVVWFGESLPMHAIDAAQQAARTCQAMLVVGTSGVVYPAAGLAHLAREAGAKVIIVNPEPTELDDVAHLVLRDTSAQVLPMLLEI